MPETLSVFLAPSVAVLLLLFYINLRMASPVLAIPIRWMRWILFAIFMAQTNSQMGWVDRPFWAVAAAVFLLWFLLESGFNWLKVSTGSSSAQRGRGGASAKVRVRGSTSSTPGAAAISARYTDGRRRAAFGDQLQNRYRSALVRAT